MTKKFVNLPHNYKKLLDDAKKLFNKENLEELATNKMTYKNLMKLYSKIEDLCNENNCNTYDLNKMINYYDKNCNYMDCDVFRVICCAEQRPFCPGE